MNELTLVTACQLILLAKKSENCSNHTITLYDNWLSRFSTSVLKLLAFWSLPAFRY